MNNQSTDFLKHKLNLYFDKALSKEEEIKLLHQAQIDPQLNFLLNKENTARQFIKTCVKRKTSSKDLKQNILDRLK